MAATVMAGGNGVIERGTRPQSMPMYPLNRKGAMQRLKEPPLDEQRCGRVVAGIGGGSTSSDDGGGGGGNGNGGGLSNH